MTDEELIDFLRTSTSASLNKIAADRIEALSLGVKYERALRIASDAASAAAYGAADDLGYTCTGCGHLCGNPDKDIDMIQRAGGISCCPERKMVPLSQAIRALATPDQTAALDRVRAEAKAEGMREAADLLRGQGYNTAVREILAAIPKSEQNHD